MRSKAPTAATTKERLQPLRNQRIVFVFDESHRSQFGENHNAVRKFFPKARLFGCAGTPIFEQNASSPQIEDQKKSYRPTEDLFQRSLHQYTITNASEDGNVLRFHIDYYKPEGDLQPKPGEALAKQRVIDTSSPAQRRHSRAQVKRHPATSSINDTIEDLKSFQMTQARRQDEDP